MFLRFTAYNPSVVATSAVVGGVAGAKLPCYTIVPPFDLNLCIAVRGEHKESEDTPIILVDCKKHAGHYDQLFILRWVDGAKLGISQYGYEKK